MDRRFAAVISASFIVCLAFTGAVGTGKVWTTQERCRMRACDKLTYNKEVHDDCVFWFKKEMVNTTYNISCPWPDTIKHYVKLMRCLETKASHTCCMDESYRHSLLIGIHEQYFSLCSYLEDPAVPVLLLLITPCVLVPFLIPLLCQCFTLH